MQIKRIHLDVFRAPAEKPVVTSFGRIPSRAVALLRLEDADGAVGWGDIWGNFPTVTTEYRANLAAFVLPELLLGQTVTDVPGFYRSLVAKLRVLALQADEPGPVASVLAATDQALWDLAARKAGQPLRKLLDGGDEPIELGFGDGAVRLVRPGQVFWFRLLDGEFPDYKAVLPSGTKHRAVVQREAFADALGRIGILAQDRTRAVRFSFGETDLQIAVHNVDRGEGREEITVELDGEPLEMGFNVRYLLEILGVLTAEHIQLEMTHNLGPCLLKQVDDETAFFVVMPMRLD